MESQIEKYFQELMPTVEFISLRFINETSEKIEVRKDKLQPLSCNYDQGVMITISHEGGTGYAATSNLSRQGIQDAIQLAQKWSKTTSLYKKSNYAPESVAPTKLTYNSQQSRPWAATPLKTKINWLLEISHAVPKRPEIVNWQVGLDHTTYNSLYLTNHGTRIHQQQSFVFPSILTFANRSSETIRRSFADRPLQGGLETVDPTQLKEKAIKLSLQAIELLDSEHCPSGKKELLLAPDQMMLQIHESIGHPLELDRILGDERNYAGTSFVNQEMFGTYQYGSELLNVTYDPTNPLGLASYGADDDGLKASKEIIIEKGLLKRPLGGSKSQQRGSLKGVACSRASSWNRPPIDRMANLNIESGDSPLDDMIQGIEDGIYMETNQSWSIDDSRNKFQFGCELGQIIKNGERKQLVKLPSYRGVSATFWRNLKAVGNENTREVHGTPYCGKGEPNQMIRVGHTSPACLFSNVDVFGAQ